MLVGNGVRFGGSPLRFSGQAGTSAAERASKTEGASIKNFHLGQATTQAKKDGIPSGVRHPVAWLMPVKPGAIASRYVISGKSEVSPTNVAGGLNAEASIQGQGTITQADMTLLIYATAVLAGAGVVSADIEGLLGAAATLSGFGAVTNASANASVSIEATLAGSSVVSNAALALVLEAAATLSGSGSISAANLAGSLAAAATITGGATLAADVIGKWEMAATLAGSGNLAGAITTIAHLSSLLVGAGTISEADMRALAGIEAEIAAAAAVGLTPQNIAEELLDIQLVESGLTIREALKLIAAATAGKVSGAPGGPIVIRSAVADDADRIIAVVDNDGNRSSITYDLD